MPKHKTEDYKLSAVKNYLKNNFSMKYVCDIFECKKQGKKSDYLFKDNLKRFEDKYGNFSLELKDNVSRKMVFISSYDRNKWCKLQYFTFNER